MIWEFKHYVLGLIMKIPFHCVRNFFLNPFLGQRGVHVEICKDIEIRVPNNIYIGNFTTINKDTLLVGRGGKIIIGDCVDIAQETRIWTLQHDYNAPDYKDVGGNVEIKDYAWLASRCTILPGVTIGKGAVVATGAIVTKNIPDYTIVAGVPAKKIGMRNENLTYKLGKQRWFH